MHVSAGRSNARGLSFTASRGGATCGAPIHLARRAGCDAGGGVGRSEGHGRRPLGSRSAAGPRLRCLLLRVTWVRRRDPGTRRRVPAVGRPGAHPRRVAAGCVRGRRTQQRRRRAHCTWGCLRHHRYRPPSSLDVMLARDAGPRRQLRRITSAANPRASQLLLAPTGSLRVGQPASPPVPSPGSLDVVLALGAGCPPANAQHHMRWQAHPTSTWAATGAAPPGTWGESCCCL